MKATSPNCTTIFSAPRLLPATCSSAALYSRKKLLVFFSRRAK
jgi:hypothetical protein